MENHPTSTLKPWTPKNKVGNAKKVLSRRGRGRARAQCGTGCRISTSRILLGARTQDSQGGELSCMRCACNASVPSRACVHVLTVPSLPATRCGAAHPPSFLSGSSVSVWGESAVTTSGGGGAVAKRPSPRLTSSAKPQARQALHQERNRGRLHARLRLRDRWEADPGPEELEPATLLPCA